MAGDADTGVAIMRLAEGLDSGPVALAEEVGDRPPTTSATLAGELAELGGELLVRALDAARRGRRSSSTEQDEAAVTYAEKIDPAERRLDPADAAAELERRVRALTPHIGAYLELAGGERLGVRAAEALPGSLAPAAVEASESGDAILIGCAEGVLRLETVQPAGGRAMAAADYLRGHGTPELAGG